MPLILSTFFAALMQLMGSLVGRVLIALGIGFVEYVGIKALVDGVKADAQAAFGAVASSPLIEWAGFFKIDVHLSIIISAIGVKLALNGLNSDRVRRLAQGVTRAN